MKVIGLAVIVLLAVIAIQLGGIGAAVTDPTPGSHTVIPCPDTDGDAYYDPPQGYCDDPNTTD